MHLVISSSCFPTVLTRKMQNVYVYNQTNKKTVNFLNFPSNKIFEFFILSVINFEEKKTFSYYIAMSFLSFFLTEICKLSRKSKELGPRKFFIVYQNAEMSNYDFLQKSVSQVFFHLMDSPSAFLVQAGLMHPV